MMENREQWIKLRLHAAINRVRFVFWRMSLSKHA